MHLRGPVGAVSRGKVIRNMNRTRLLVGLVGAIVIAFFLSFLVYRQLKNAALVRPPATRTIVVAAVPLQASEARVDASNLRLMPWPG